MRGRYLLLAPSRRRPGAGFDGAELRGPITRVRPALAPMPATQRNPAPELRARNRHEALLAFSATREEEIDPLPSSRPAQLSSMGIGSIETAPASDGDIEGALREVRRG